MIDTHAHLLYYQDIDDIVKRMKDDGLSVIVNIGTTAQDSQQGIKIAEKYENVYTTVGIYPEYADEIEENDLQQIAELATKNKVVAIGEIGLDYHTEGYNKEKQIEILRFSEWR